MNKNLRRSIRITINKINDLKPTIALYDTGEFDNVRVVDVPSMLNEEEKVEFVDMMNGVNDVFCRVKKHYSMEAMSLSSVEQHFYGSDRYYSISESCSCLESAKNSAECIDSFSDLVEQMNDVIDSLEAAVA